MYTFRRYWIWICLLILLLVFLSILHSYEVVETNILITASAGLITGFISIFNYHQNNDRFFKELFTDFNSRYDKLNNDLNKIVAGQPVTPELRQKVVDYLNLCAEEYMWVKKGRIPSDIWESWKNGIKANLANPVIQSIYDEEQAKWRYSYYGFFEAMKSG